MNRFAGDDSGRQLHEYFLSNRANGLLLLDGSLNLEQLLVLTGEPANVPLVMACKAIRGALFHIVKTDNAYAAEVATRYLIGLGHSRAGHILGPAGNVLTQERESGFRTAMAASDLPDEWMFAGGFEVKHGLAAAEQYMALTERPSAVFCANDETAIGLLSGLRQHRLKCPGDISVVGFDDLALAAHFWPALTTMHQPREALGRLTAEALIDLINSKPRARVLQHSVLSSGLIMRESTARAPLMIVPKAAHTIGRGRTGLRSSSLRQNPLYGTGLVLVL